MAGANPPFIHRHLWPAQRQRYFDVILAVEMWQMVSLTGTKYFDDDYYPLADFRLR
jgi:hypothetical protein